MKHPIETLTFYENEEIQKVYWTDGINQPRMINIARETTYPNNWQFDFIKNLKLREKVTVTKQQGGAGQFPPGTVKYAITYYNKYGQESNIAWVSTLFYPTKGDRGLKEDELSGDVFQIKVNNVDNENQWDYIRLYSILRTTDDSTPVVRIVDSKPIGNPVVNPITFYDSNTTGEIIDPTILQYLGGKEIIAETFDQKDNTLFFGNIELTTKSLKNIEDRYPLEWNTDSLQFISDYKTIVFANQTRGASTFYNWMNQLNVSQNPKIFKKGEYYRFGIQFQDFKGNWSEVKYLGDRLNNLVIDTSDNYQATFPVCEYTLAKATKDVLKHYYKKARLVCCYPTNNDRLVLAQGILCPTLYNNSWREKHSPDAISSWFQRTDGSAHSQAIPKGELQSMETTGLNEFRFDTHIVTFHSPDIEFDESLRTLDWSNMTLQIIGEANPTTYATKLYLDSANQAEDYLGNKGTGFKDLSSSGIYTNLSLSKYGVWNDIDVYNSNALAIKDKKYQKFAITYDYPIYPFQRKYLHNYMGDLSIQIYNKGLREDPEFLVNESSSIRQKVWSTLKFSLKSDYNRNASFLLNDCQVFDSNEAIPLRIKTDKGDYIYQGNVNTLAPVDAEVTLRTPIWEYQGLNPTGSIDNVSWTANSVQENGTIISFFTGKYKSTHEKFGDWTYEGKSNHGAPVGVYSDPIPLTYKSTTHCVLSLPVYYTFPEGKVLLAELRRQDDLNMQQQRFGGTSEEAILHNQFIPCSHTYDLNSESNLDGSLTLIHDEGDTYYMRYDHLKTYPYTREDINQVVDIYSFMCETRINLDGRSDKNRGLTDNTLIDNTNFNYINRSYTQKDNTFVYHTLDKLHGELNSFPNQLTWTKDKIPAEDIDSWTNITLASIANADGTVGEIRKIVNWKDNLLLFQDHGISQIGYNERTAISTANGIPLELANSGKFTGLTYLSKEVGCQNKWSISTSKNGIFFIDDSRQEILQFGENFPSLSTLTGFDAFMIQQLPSNFVKWNPNDFDNFITHYDKLSNDVYFINKDYCLAWNEQVGTFTSFYNYEEVPYMANIGNHSLMWKNSKIYSAREGSLHSNFFGVTKPYWITLVCDGISSDGNAFPADKVFNNIEYRADIFDRVSALPRADINLPVFTHKAAWNGYQLYKEFDADAIRKFNIWRIQLPRATYRDASGNLITTRDRVRNPFCYIKLVNNNPAESNSNHRAVLHDFAVYYDMK